MTAHMADGGGPPRTPWRRVLWSAGGAILLLPAVAMQVTDEVNWGFGDFAFAAALVIGAGTALELVTRATKDRAYRAAVAVALATAVMLIWTNAALGVAGSEGNPVNLVFGGVPAIGFVGALMARAQPKGMGIALTATALAQVLAGLIALLAGAQRTDLGFAVEILGLSALFAALWLLSARLFQKAAQQQGSVRPAPRA